MSGPNFASDDARQPRPANAEQGATPQPMQDPELLDRVLRSTLAMVQSDEAIEPQEMDALLAVAGRHRGESLNTDPVARELVEAMLRPRFQALSTSEDFWRHISLWIASALMDDPQAQQRLESLWMRLLDKNP